jgi:cytochrome c-type biogenesis protein CcmH/NrfG
LELAVKRAPSDRNLRTLLAQGLRQAGRNPQARKLLEDLLEEMGRRRSRERAAIHHQLALVARSEGNVASRLSIWIRPPPWTWVGNRCC